MPDAVFDGGMGNTTAARMFAIAKGLLHLPHEVCGVCSAQACGCLEIRSQAFLLKRGNSQGALSRRQESGAPAQAAR